MPKVLIVDDAKVTRLVLKKFISEFNFEVIEAQNGLDALDVVKENPDLDVIFMDWNLPKLNGVEFTIKLREMENHTPVFMITSMNGATDRELANGAGVDEYLLKPFKKEQIIELLEKHHLIPS